MANIRSFRELAVYQMAMDAAMQIYALTRQFPSDERYSMVDQVRRASRSVCANVAEAWRKRRYEAHFVSKLTDAEAEAEETRVWLEFSLRCGYLAKEDFDELDAVYDNILGKLVRMHAEPKQWAVR